jgi:hypothetical protein
MGYVLENGASFVWKDRSNDGQSWPSMMGAEFLGHLVRGMKVLTQLVAAGKFSEFKYIACILNIKKTLNKNLLSDQK